MFEIKDLAGISEPIKKLIEVIAQGVGGVSHSMLTRKNAEAKAYEIRTIAQAIADSQKLLGPVEYDDGTVVIKSLVIPEIVVLPEASLDKRVLARLTFQEEKRQSNVEQITQFAAEELSDATDKIEGDVDSDWITRFFRIAEDISIEQMQSLWGKVLAGEVKKPGSYSLRTLELLKNITQTEAALFVRVAKYAMINANGDSVCIFNPDSGISLKQNHNITFDDLLLLRHLNIIHPTDLEYTLSACDEDAHVVLTCGNTYVMIIRPKGTPIQKFQVIVFTEIGKQLLQFVDKEQCDIKYLETSMASFKTGGVVVEYGQIVDRIGDTLFKAT